MSLFQPLKIHSGITYYESFLSADRQNVGSKWSAHMLACSHAHKECCLPDTCLSTYICACTNTIYEKTLQKQGLALAQHAKICRLLLLLDKSPFIDRCLCSTLCLTSTQQTTWANTKSKSSQNIPSSPDLFALSCSLQFFPASHCLYCFLFLSSIPLFFFVPLFLCFSFAPC